MSNDTKITVETVVNAPVEKTWQYWTEPEHIQMWNAASDDWHCPSATNDLRVGGEFHAQMAARDGSFSFDFTGVYSDVTPHSHLTYGLADGRKVDVRFEKMGEQTKVTETFDPEQENSMEMQKGGWQAILDRFKSHVESN